jgi:Tol biopolymer transport system component
MLAIRPLGVLSVAAVLASLGLVAGSQGVVNSPRSAGRCSDGHAGDYTAFKPAQPVLISGYRGDAMEPFVSRDGNRLFFNDRNDPGADTNLFFAVRTGPLQFRFAGPVTVANSTTLDAVASVDTSDQLYFVSVRSYPSSLKTIYMARLSGDNHPVALPVEGVSRLTPGQVNFDAEISGDGHHLWFVDGLFDGGPVPKRASIATASGSGLHFVRDSDSDVRLRRVNADGLNYAPSVSKDGRELFFTRMVVGPSALPVICRSVAGADGVFGEPQQVAAAAGFVEAPSLSDDGRSLYFHRRDGDRYVIFRADRQRRDADIAP